MSGKSGTRGYLKKNRRGRGSKRKNAEEYGYAQRDKRDKIGMGIVDEKCRVVDSKLKGVVMPERGQEGKILGIV